MTSASLDDEIVFSQLLLVYVNILNPRLCFNRDKLSFLFIQARSQKNGPNKFREVIEDAVSKSSSGPFGRKKWY